MTTEGRVRVLSPDGEAGITLNNTEYCKSFKEWFAIFESLMQQWSFYKGRACDGCTLLATNFLGGAGLQGKYCNDCLDLLSEGMKSNDKRTAP